MHVFLISKLNYGFEKPFVFIYYYKHPMWVFSPLSVLCCAQARPNLCDHFDWRLPGSSVRGDFPGKNIAIPPPGDLLNPGIEPRSPALQTDPLPSEPPGQPMSTGMGSLSLLQGMFLTHGSPALHVYSLPVELSGKPSPLSGHNLTVEGEIFLFTLPFLDINSFYPPSLFY